MNSRVSNIIQMGLVIKWKQINWAQQLHNVKIIIKKEIIINENNLSLNQISLAFYITLFSLPILTLTLLIEVFCRKLKLNKKN